MRPISAACHACVSESLPSVAETSVRSICWNVTGSAPVWRIEREVLRLTDRAAVAEVDLGVRAGDPVRVALEVDVRRRLELPVEHDREVLDVVEVVALLPAEIELRLTALRLFARDLLELVRAVVRELQCHDRPAALAEVGAGAREHEVAAGHLRHGVPRAVRVEVHQVVVRAGRRHGARTEAPRRGLAAHHDACAPEPSGPDSSAGPCRRTA